MDGGSSNTDKQASPDPAKATDLTDYASLLDQLRIRCGEPSYRTLARKVGPLLRPPRVLAHSTVATLFQPQRRRLDQDLLTAVVRALTADEPTVHRWREAYLRIQRDAKAGGPTGVFRQLPADLATFTGREIPLRDLVEAATAPARDRATTVVVSAIEGMGGIGKTELAVHAAHELLRAGHYGGVQLFVNLRGFDPDQPPASPSSVLEAFLRQLGVPDQHIPANIDERAVMFRDRLAGRQALIVLDNAADENQVRDLIPAGPDCLVLITSRRSLAGLDGAHLCRLGVFDKNEAITMLARIVGKERVDAEPATAENIVAMCGYMPLAISLAGARLRSRPTWSLSDLSGRLERGLEGFAAGTRSLVPIFELSYRGLPDLDQRVFRALGAHPGPDFTAASTAVAAGVDPERADRCLQRLLDEYLIQEKTPGRFELHDLLRAYAVELFLKQTPENEQTAAVERLLSWYLAQAHAAASAISPTRHAPPLGELAAVGDFRESAQALSWYDQEYPNLAALFATACEMSGSDYPWQLAGTVSMYLRLRCRFAEVERIHSTALACARAAGSRTGEAWILSDLGSVLAERGRPHDAVEHLECALDLSRDLGDAAGEATTLGRLAHAYVISGRPEDGLRYSLQALDLARSAGDRAREASALNKVGGCLCMLGRFEEALPYLHAKRALHLADGDMNALSLALHNLAETHEALGQYTEALEVFGDYLTIAQNAGDLHGEAGARFGIARCRQATGADSTAVVEILEPACAIFDDLEVPEAVDARSLLEKVRAPVR
ncbi:tetratricopeptide (TPR) repeat protein [Catenulispora sp. GAS73]|uniref:ATP-binding protein n=1 Tax=Catenulispora sp. GAS73 TaxID=3156269 RepID=UPI003513B0A3